MAGATKNFSEQIKRLEEIVENMESSELDLETSMKLFEEGMSISKSCQKTLEESESKIKKLVNGEVQDFS